MRKLLFFACFMTFFIRSSSQRLDDLLSTEAKKKNAIILKQVDSMHKVLPTLKREELVNGLITLSGKFLYLPLSKQVKADSTNKYLSLALAESKKIGYKKGMGLAYSKLSGVEVFKNDIYWDNNKKPNDKKIAEFLDAAELLLKKAIEIGEKTNNNMILGGSYWILAGVVERRVWNDTSDINWQKMNDEKEKILRKAIYYTEKQGSELTEGSYRDIGFLTCAGCTGNERWLGGLYRDVAMLLFQKRDYKNAIELNKKSISYYKKGGEKALEGYMHNSQANIYRTTGDIAAEEESWKSALDLFTENTNPEWENNACIGLIALYLARGEFEKSFPYCERSLKIMEALDKSSEKGTTNRSGSIYWMARLYKVAGDYETALQYMRQNSPNNAGNKISVTNWKAEIGDLFREMGNYDSAMYYLGPAGDPKNNSTPLGKLNLGTLYISLKEFDKALPLLEENVRNIRKGNNNNNNNLIGLGINLTALAKAYAGKKQNQKALSAATEGLTILQQNQRRWFMVSSFEVLADIYQNLGKYDSAFYYLRMHTSLKDSMLSRQFYWRLNTLKKQSEEDKRTSQIMLLQKDNLIKEQLLQQQLLSKGQNEAQIALLDKDNELKEQQLRIKEQELNQQTLLRDQNQSQLTLLDKENKLKDQRLKQQSFIRNTLLGGLVLFFLLSVFVYRSFSLKRKNEKLVVKKSQAELQQKVTELETQALRAQMNPHFIFNCLSSINKFILKNDTDTASDYLTRFSRLIRQSLTNSQLSLIPLSDEVEMLRLYLDMERLRFSESFNYTIVYENTIEPESIYIPPMLLQPFCENAIWHGLMHKEGPRKLEIIMSLQNGELQCLIADNGIGREKAAELKSRSNSKQKSFGLKITTERLALFNDEKAVHSFYKTEDVVDPDGHIAGTRVILNIRFKNSVPQPVKETV